MHVCQCVFLGRSEISDTTSSVLIFSREFGKIRAFRKEGRGKSITPLDIGTLFEATIETKGSSNRLVSAKVRSGFSSLWCDYAEVSLFLETFGIIRTHLHEGAENAEIFDLIALCLKELSPGRIQFVLSLFLLKLSILLGIAEFPSPTKENIQLLKLLHATKEYPFSTVLNIKGITPELLDQAKNHASLAFHRHLI